MVTCAISGTCHHKVNLARVNSFNNIYFINKLRNINSIHTRYLSSYNIQRLAPYFVVRSSNFDFFSKYVRWLYVPSEGHITTYIDISSLKKPLNYQVEQHLRLINSYICQEFLSLPGTYYFLPKQCQMVTFTINGTCHHEVNLAPLIN